MTLLVASSYVFKARKDGYIWRHCHIGAQNNRWCDLKGLKEKEVIFHVISTLTSNQTPERFGLLKWYLIHTLCHVMEAKDLSAGSVNLKVGKQPAKVTNSGLEMVRQSEARAINAVLSSKEVKPSSTFIATPYHPVTHTSKRTFVFNCLVLWRNIILLFSCDRWDRGH